MKGSAFALLLPLLLLLPGCERTQRTDFSMLQGIDASAAQNTGSGVAQSSDSGAPLLSEDPVCRSNISAADCYLCGGGIEKLIPSQ